MEKEEKHFVYHINAGYRPEDRDHLWYYVYAKSKKEAREIFKYYMCLTIYKVVQYNEEESELLIEKFLADPFSMYIFGWLKQQQQE